MSASASDARPTPPVGGPRLILASRSPRRALLLEQAGYAFQVIDPPYADPADPNRAAPEAAAAGVGVSVVDPADNSNSRGVESGVALAGWLARRKARSVDLAALPRDAVVMAADTLAVDAEGGLLGTPESVDQARAMLSGLMGRPHRIATGVALRQHLADGTDGIDGAGADIQSFVDQAVVCFPRIDPGELSAYLDSGRWRGKAGGYNLAERRAAGWDIDVQGDPATVMGLPMRRLIPRLEELGVGRTTAGGRAAACPDPVTPGVGR